MATNEPVETEISKESPSQTAETEEEPQTLEENKDLTEKTEHPPSDALNNDSQDLDISSDYSNISNPESEVEPPDVKQDEGNVSSETKEKSESSDMPTLPLETLLSSTDKKDISQEEIPKRDKKLKPVKKSCSKTEAELNDLCANMFSKLEEYLKGEVASSVEDYALLERMNKSTTYKYQNMLQVATAVGQSMHEINHKFSDLRPYLDQIENIEENVLVLEKAAYKLDAYAKRLEERFKKLEKR